MRDSILVVEFGSHLNQLNHISAVLRTFGDLKFVFRQLDDTPWDSVFYNGVLHTCTSFKAYGLRKLSTVLFYIEILKRSRRSALIWISTGPEHKAVPDIMFIQALFFCYRKKMVISIRNTGSWIQTPGDLGAHSILNFLRARIARKALRLVFETETQRRYFGKQNELANPLTSVLSTKIYGERPAGAAGTISSSLDSSSRGVRIGLLGGVENSRRNYDLLASALKRLDVRTRSRIEFLILGHTLNSDADSILDELRELVVVRTFGRFLSSHDEFALGQHCSFLIAPLREGKEVGLARGTGSFGDAINLGRKVVIPRSCDPEGEMKGIATLYEGEAELARIISKWVSISKIQTINPRILRPYQAHAVSNKIREELCLGDDLAIPPSSAQL